MHVEAYRYVQRVVRSLSAPPRRVVELGSYNLNGSVRDLFPGAAYVGVDQRPGPGVDIVADAAEWGEDSRFDCVVCTEVLEHTPTGIEICSNALWLLAPGGVFIVTAAAPPRPPHSGVDGQPRLLPGEFYRNVSKADLQFWLYPFAFVLVDDGENPGDVYATAFKS